MTTITTERAFEDAVEQILLNNGWRKGNASEWDVDKALFSGHVVDYIKKTHKESWDKAYKVYGLHVESSLVDALIKTINDVGTIYVLRNGFKFCGETFRVAAFKPANGLNSNILEAYESNRLHVTRQVKCHPGQNHTVDILLSLNGIPVATCELKNPMSGQSYNDAIEQFKERKQTAPLFKFKRGALVHFAADCDQIYMTTALRGTNTKFIPFNKGNAPGEVICGAGNPSNPNGYNTQYFWDEVLNPDKFLDIINQFVFIEESREKQYDDNGLVTNKIHRNIIFPRYHQLDVLGRLLESTQTLGPGHNYLIQHSPGSGKTKTISWLAHRLSTLHDLSGNLVYDSVIVMTDRVGIVKQLQDAIYQIERTRGVVELIDRDSAQLAIALINGSKIIVTTIQKFQFITHNLLNIAGEDDETSEYTVKQVDKWREQIAGRNYAIIVDEGHSSQSGSNARQLKSVVGSKYVHSTDDDTNSNIETQLNEMAESKGPQTNLSFFAFTATPKAKTIELFGTMGADGKPHPFHVYSMRQAIEEGFILNVLENYTAYETYYRLNKIAQEDPDFPRRKAAARLARFAALHPYNINQKAAVIVDHFREHVGHLMHGKAKAMLVTESRIEAVHFYNSITKYIKDNKYTDVSVLVAFSGTVTDPNSKIEYTEHNMNIDVITGKYIKESATLERFDSTDYNLLIVADKHQTGYDQPKLQAMYVDKRLNGIQAVQTLSRLNRPYPGKQSPIVLDFINNPADIVDSFAPYYDHTEIEDVTDPYLLDRLKTELDEMGIYHSPEVDGFASTYFSDRNLSHSRTHKKLQSNLQNAIKRYNEAEESIAFDFRRKLGAFCRLYEFLSQIIPYSDGELEKLALYGKFLLSCLKAQTEGLSMNVASHVDLEFYRLQRKWHGSLDIEGSKKVSGPTESGTSYASEPKAPLSEILDLLNRNHGMGLEESDRLFIQQIIEKTSENYEVRVLAESNEYEKFALAIPKILEKVMIQLLDTNKKLVNDYISNEDINRVIFPLIARAIFDKVRSEGE